MKQLTEKWLTDRGFEGVSWFTVLNTLNLPLGRRRYLSVSGCGTPNEMISINEREGDLSNPKVLDVVILKNYDYDGSSSTKDVELLYKAITGKKLKI